MCRSRGCLEMRYATEDDLHSSVLFPSDLWLGSATLTGLVDVVHKAKARLPSQHNLNKPLTHRLEANHITPITTSHPPHSNAMDDLELDLTIAIAIAVLIPLDRALQVTATFNMFTHLYHRINRLSPRLALTFAIQAILLLAISLPLSALIAFLLIDYSLYLLFALRSFDAYEVGAATGQAIDALGGVDTLGAFVRSEVFVVALACGVVYGAGVGAGFVMRRVFRGYVEGWVGALERWVAVPPGMLEQELRRARRGWGGRIR
ncbi:hypothetical protein EJ04DRAFT_524037 [Polyplosphaeria fusca]|uniref:Uncharacterized protein n=1 Tax=Polyplosphaeria fusca TaxID=682080 RepID=A0A9P4QUL7_9PLEO|nr:hypothetical protein EJ04DRAFT_524037 [Polyplosphaeria fusca]